MIENLVTSLEVSKRLSYHNYRHEIRAGIIESMVQQGYLDKKYK